MALHYDSARRSYKGAGVDVDAASRAKKLIKPLVRSTFRPGVLGDFGSFSGLFQLQGYEEPVLVTSTDNVGTKVMIAIQMGRFDTIGIDVVNQSVNDTLVAGAEPLFFLDYIGLDRMVPEQAGALVKGVVQACRAAGCALIGGETAELPGLYQPGNLDLAGFIVGVVERERLIDGTRIQTGDVILGLPSSGLHTNGYSLARQIFRTDQEPEVLRSFRPELGRTLGEALLEPHRAYYPLLKPVLSHVSGMAHVTGGGLEGNLPRVLPPGMAAQLHRRAWQVPSIFRLIQEAGGIEEGEMWRVFNMGIGMAVIAGAQEAREIARLIPEAFAIGRVVPLRGEARVIFEDGDVP